MQVIEKWPLLARLQFAPRCIFSKSPCIFVKSIGLIRLPRSSKRRPARRAAEPLSRTCRATALATRLARTASNRSILKRLTFIAERLNQDYLLGAGFSVPDAYLFVMLMWARKNGLSLPVPLPAYFERMKARPAVQRSLKEEGLL
jgi:glutathione S-transferase